MSLLDRTVLVALASTTETAVLTDVNNDYRFERVFARKSRGFEFLIGGAMALKTMASLRNLFPFLKVRFKLFFHLVFI